MINKIIYFIIILCAFNINLYAACNNETLVNEAKNVIVTSTPKKSEEGEYYFIIKIENMKNNQVLTISEDFLNTQKTYKYNNTKKGVLELTDKYIYSKNTYKIKIYSLDSSCQNMLLDTKIVSTIKFNNYATYDICQGNEEFEMCKPFYDNEIVSKEIFNSAFEEYKKEKEESLWDKVLEIIKEYYLYILIPILTISLGYYLYIIVNKWRRKI